VYVKWDTLENKVGCVVYKARSWFLDCCHV